MSENIFSEAALAIHGGQRAIQREQPHDEWPITTEEEVERIREYCAEGRPKAFYGRSDLFADLEDQFADYHDSEYGVLTNTGTSALNSAFFALGLEPGDEVIAPTYTFLATVTPIFQQGGQPVFADSRPDTGLIDPESVREQVTDSTEAIVVTHMWGHPVDMEPILDIAAEHDLAVVEDCAHAHGAKYKGTPVGTIGDIGCFSLGSTKLVSGGELGIVLTDDSEIRDRVSLHGHFGLRAHQEVESDFYAKFTDVGYGQNYRPHPLAVVQAKTQFDRMEEWMDTRQKCLNNLTDALADVPGVKPPVTREYVEHGAYHGYIPQFVPGDFDENISVEQYAAALRAEGAEIELFEMTLHNKPFFQTYQDGYYGRGTPPEHWLEHKRIYEDGDFPGAEEYSENRMALPRFTHGDEDLVQQYVDAFKKVADNPAAVAAIDPEE